MTLPFTEVKGKKCGTVQYPLQRVCINCHAKDEFQDYCFADKTGTLTTFSQDTVATTEALPAMICAVGFSEGGLHVT